MSVKSFILFFHNLAATAPPTRPLSVSALACCQAPPLCKTVPPGARATFFVGGVNASDANPGTASAPIATIQKAANVAKPGDVVKIRDGIYRETGNQHVAWLQQRAAPYVPSFLVAGKYLYVIKDSGRLSCYDAVTGTSVYQERLRGHFTASPWMCGDTLFFLNERGDTHVVQSGPTFRLLATNTLERLCLATPAVAGDRLLIRTSSRLYCIVSDK